MSDASAVVLAIQDAVREEIAQLESVLIPVVDDFNPPIGIDDPLRAKIPTSREHPSLRLLYDGDSNRLAGWRYWVETDGLHWLVSKIEGYLSEMHR